MSPSVKETPSYPQTTECTHALNATRSVLDAELAGTQIASPVVMQISLPMVRAPV